MLGLVVAMIVLGFALTLIGAVRPLVRARRAYGSERRLTYGNLPAVVESGSHRAADVVLVLFGALVSSAAAILSLLVET